MLKLSFSRAKPHFCETEAIVELVRRDILARGGGEAVTTSHNAQIILDCGGVLFVGLSPSEVPGTAIIFFPQHYSLLRNLVSQATLRADGGYYKLHVNAAYCLSVGTFEGLRAYMLEHEKELLGQEAAVTEILQERLATLAHHPNIDFKPQA